MVPADPSHRPFSLDEALTVLRQTPQVLSALLAGLPPRLLAVNEGPGTWSPIDVLRHLLWCEVDDWVQRVRIIRTKGPAHSFKSFDREEGFRRYADWPVDRLLQEFTRLRADSVAEIEGMHLSAADLAAEGQHPAFGRVSLEQLLGTWVTHDFAHLTQVARVLTKEAGRHAGPWRAYFSVLRE
jgi:hypothetical protein